MQERKVARSVVDSYARLCDTKDRVATSLDTGAVKRRMDKVARPSSPSSTLKKAGVALIVGTPDPLTAVPGVALLAASMATKSREPAKLVDLALETRRILREMQSLRL